MLTSSGAPRPYVSRLRLAVFTVLALAILHEFVQWFLGFDFRARVNGTGVIGMVLDAVDLSFLIVPMLRYMIPVVLLHVLTVAYPLLAKRYLHGTTAWRESTIDGICFFGFAAIWLSINLFNALLYPNSEFAFLGGGDGVGTGVWLLGACLVTIAFLPLVVIVVVAVMHHRRRLMVSGAVTSIVVSVLWIAAVPSGLHGDVVPASSQRPNVVLIGLDSLRWDVLTDANARSRVPAISGFFEQSVVYDYAFTPLGRTYPSWMTVLTGQSPQRSGARMHLQAPADVDHQHTLAHALRREGYETIYAMDERRFSNIDEVYGFDRVIGHDIGAQEMLLAAITDLPLINLMINSPAGPVLFPYGSQNRAVYRSYDPAQFSEWLNLQLDGMGAGPELLAVHYCVAHWPFKWRTSEWIPEDLVDTREESFTPRQYLNYEQALVALDTQVRMLLDKLEQEGVLGNAIVVMFSDHGEGFNRPGDVPRPVQEGRDDPALTAWGHGTNIFSRVQLHIPLAIRGYGDVELSPAVVSDLASTMDITPTVLDLLGVDAAYPFDGRSLLRPDPDSDRVLFVESGVNIKSLEKINQQGAVDVAQVLDEAMAFYDIKPDGRIVIDSEVLPTLVSSKQMGVTDGTGLVGVIPEGAETRRAFYADWQSGTIVRLTPDTAPDLCRGSCPRLVRRLGDYHALARTVIEPIVAAIDTGHPRPDPMLVADRPRGIR